MTMSSKLSIVATADLAETLDLGTRTAALRRAFGTSLGNGTGTGLADKVFQDTRTIAPSTSEDLDLNAGALVDPFGVAFTILRVKALYVAAAVANVNNVVIGAAAANPWTALLGATHTMQLRPGAAVLLSAGEADPTTYAVVAGTGDVLRFTNGGAVTSVTYDVMIIGSSV